MTPEAHVRFTGVYQLFGNIAAVLDLNLAI